MASPASQPTPSGPGAANQPTTEPTGRTHTRLLAYLLLTHTHSDHTQSEPVRPGRCPPPAACLPPCSVAFQQRRLPIAAAATAIRHPRTYRTHACLAVLCASSFRRLLSSLSTRPVRCSRDSRRLAGVAWLSHSLTISGNRRITD